jgi:hypothetical protein
MNVRPTQVGPGSPCDAGALKRARSAEPAAEAPEATRIPGAPSDQVELSEAARELQANLATRAPADLSPERWNAILGRLSQGHYDRPEVRDRIIERLAHELENESFPD